MRPILIIARVKKTLFINVLLQGQTLGLGSRSGVLSGRLAPREVGRLLETRDLQGKNQAQETPRNADSTSEAAETSWRAAIFSARLLSAIETCAVCIHHSCFCDLALLDKSGLVCLQHCATISCARRHQLRPSPNCPIEDAVVSCHGLPTLSRHTPL